MTLTCTTRKRYLKYRSRAVGCGAWFWREDLADISVDWRLDCWRRMQWRAVDAQRLQYASVEMVVQCLLPTPSTRSANRTSAHSEMRQCSLHYIVLHHNLFIQPGMHLCISVDVGIQHSRVTFYLYTTPCFRKKHPLILLAISLGIVVWF